MRSKARLHAQLGFNSGARDGAKHAFTRYLFKAAASASAENFSTTAELPPTSEQLSFDPAALGPASAKPNPKK